MNRRERGEYLETRITEEMALLEEELNKGVSQSFLDLLELYSRFHKYSLANCMLIAMQCPKASYCAGFRKWESMGYHVKKGSQAIWIRGPLLKKVPDRTTGELVERLVGYIAVPVFDISQLVEKVEIPDFTQPLDGDWEMAYQMARVNIGATSILCDEEPMPTDIHGMSFGGRIVINPKLSTSEKFICLLHELGHEHLHWNEIRDETTRDQRELEAESVSFLLARMYGLTNPYSKDYILHWKGTVEKLHESLTRITLAVRECVKILGIEQQVAKAA